MIGIRIKGLTSVKHNIAYLKSQNTVTKWTERGFLLPSLVWRCLGSRFNFSCVVTPSSPKRSVWRVYWKFHALSWLFLCLDFLETWERSEPSGPECDYCELASESNCVLWADIVNSRLENKGRIQISLFDFVPFLHFCIGVGHVAVTVKKRRDCVCVLNLFF